MRVPSITINSNEVTVDTVDHRRGRFGLSGERQWRIVWRSITRPAVRGVSILDADQLSGSASVDGQHFTYRVRWIEDRRRPIGRRQGETPYANSVRPVTERISH